MSTTCPDVIPLSRHLDEAVVVLCGRCWPDGFDVSERAPDSYEALKAEYAQRGRITVYSGNSHQSIYGSPAVNHMARAWHDWAHLALGADFTLEGETEAYMLQCGQLAGLYGRSVAKGLATLLEAEVLGQVRYYMRWRKYVVRQRDFVVAYLDDSQAALATDFD